MKKVLIVFGTRPEAIKMAPLVKAFENDEKINSRVCVTGQHREMLDQVLELFKIVPDYDLNIMKKGQDLFDVTAKVLLGMKNILIEFKPDIVFIHGDTTTSSIAGLAAFYQKIKIAHVEAGLRTNNIYNPWPEEANRQITSIITNYHFAPTHESKINLLNEKKPRDSIIVTGNTVIDALFLTLDNIENDQNTKNKIISILCKQYQLNDSRKFILVTGHRRECFGDGLINICNAIKLISRDNPNIDIVYPVHPNPNIQTTVYRILNNLSNIYLIDPLNYETFIYLMKRSYFVISDSGGIQEEAPSLGKPVLVTRETTERPEALKAGTVKLVGNNVQLIKNESQKLIDNKLAYEKMSKAQNPYGSGKACKIIVNYINKL